MYIFRYDNGDELDMSIYQLGHLIDIAKRNTNVRQIVRNNRACGGEQCNLRGKSTRWI